MYKRSIVLTGLSFAVNRGSLDTSRNKAEQILLCSWDFSKNNCDHMDFIDGRMIISKPKLMGLNF